jgi:hypothetical protein
MGRVRMIFTKYLVIGFRLSVTLSSEPDMFDIIIVRQIFDMKDDS